MKIEIEAKIREAGKKTAKNLRMLEQIPAVVYGKGIDSKSVSIDYKTFRKIYMAIQGKKSFIFLKIEGEKEAVRTLIKEMQIEPVSRKVTHIDFQIILSGQLIEIEVPIKPVGDSPGMKEGGIMEILLRELDVKCLPKDLPESIEIDISNLNLNDSVHISDILENYPNIEILHPADTSILSIQPPYVVEEEEEEEEEEEKEGEKTEVPEEKPEAEQKK
ncbi:MAG: 50S ribosomal protein L25 [Candidatus Cloacimonadota bacterium]|nr:50S ribosomal protein L25 [Candidatus Cloacimonadota bacterium]